MGTPSLLPIREGGVLRIFIAHDLWVQWQALTTTPPRRLPCHVRINQSLDSGRLFWGSLGCEFQSYWTDGYDQVRVVCCPMYVVTVQQAKFPFKVSYQMLKKLNSAGNVCKERPVSECFLTPNTHRHARMDYASANEITVSQCLVIVTREQQNKLLPAWGKAVLLRGH
jgi:hypothetical protein